MSVILADSLSNDFHPDVTLLNYILLNSTELHEIILLSFLHRCYEYHCDSTQYKSPIPFCLVINLLLIFVYDQ